MQECIEFQLKVKKKIPEVMEFVTKKMVEEKMVSYCGNDQTAIEQFGWWCEKYLDVDKKKGKVNGYSSVQMYYDYIYIFQSFIQDLAANIPDAEFTGSIEKNNDEIGTEITIDFTFKKNELHLEEIEPECDEEAWDDEDWSEDDEGWDGEE